jgi:predicted DNA-binding antitoxin AbrB/MazE fold protein
MAQHARAIYENGTLRLLDKVDFQEGQTVELVLQTPRDKVRAILKDMLMEIPDDGEDDIDEEALMREIDEGTRGVTLSDAVLEEREQGW